MGVWFGATIVIASYGMSNNSLIMALVSKTATNRRAEKAVQLLGTGHNGSKVNIHALQQY